MSAIVTVTPPDDRTGQLYGIRCSECGFVIGTANDVRAERLAEDHRAKHRESWPPKLERKDG